jgi:proteasome lid subunit RPN8/RPN11
MWEAVLDHLAGCLPNEGVALIATSSQSAEDRQAWHAQRLYRGSNTRNSPVRFEMDPREIVAALREIDREAWHLGAIVHSHPNGPPTPSPTDLAEAAYPDALMVIVSWAAGRPEARAWALEPNGASWQPRAISLEIIP